MKILFKFATRSRPSLFFRGLKSIQDFTTCDYEVLVTADIDDIHMNNSFVLNEAKQYKNLTWAWGESRSKIHAINRDMDKAVSDWNVLVNMSDDMIFFEPKWNEILEKYVSIDFKDNDWFAHFNDGYTGSAIPSMSIMGRKYYERFNRIYPEIYKSLWSDNHVMEEAKILGKYKYYDYCLFNHLHPANVNIAQDDLYKHNESYYDEDKLIYEKQKINNFGLRIE